MVNSLPIACNLVFLPSPQQKHALFRCLMYSGGAVKRESSTSYSLTVREYVGGGDSGQAFTVCNVLLDIKI